LKRGGGSPVPKGSGKKRVERGNEARREENETSSQFFKSKKTSSGSNPGKISFFKLGDKNMFLSKKNACFDYT